MARNGKQKSGAQKYRCVRGCLTPEGKSVTCTEGDRARGCPTLGDRALTQYERTERYKKAHPEKYQEIHKYKPKK